MNPVPENPDSPTPSDREPVVLVLTPTGRDADLSCRMLRQAGLDCIACRSFDELMDRIAADAGPVVIAAEAITAEAAERLRARLDAQPKWSDLPVIIFTGRGGLPRHLERIVRRRNTTLLHRPIQVTSFVTMLRVAVENRLRQYEVRDLLQKLSDRAAQLQQLALELTEAEERERHRLAGILHDDLQQTLAAANFHVNLLPRHAAQNGLEKAVRSLSDILQQAIEKSRRLSHDLSPPTLRQNGLVAALHWLADRMQQMHGLGVEVDAAAEAEPPDMSLQMFLFRSAQEFLFNVIKHAKTGQAYLQLSRTDDLVRLLVRDRGVGFQPEEKADRPAGFGLFSIRERAVLLGGKVHIESARGQGSSFVLTMPWQWAGTGTDLENEFRAGETVPEIAPEPEAGVTSPVLRVALVDDHQVMRSGIRALLVDQENIDVIAEADNGMDAVELAGRYHPDVMLMDVAMPRMNGVEATRRIKALYPDIRIIGLSMFNDPETAARMRQAGAEAYLCKTGSGEALIRAVQGKPASSAN